MEPQPQQPITTITHNNSNIQDQQQQNFSSMSSHNQNFQPQSNPISYTYHHHHKQRQIPLPPILPNIPKLYQIYLQNQTRKHQLKSAIKDLIQKQLKNLQLKYDQDTAEIQQYIDNEEMSEEYLVSRQKYERRQETLLNCNKQYEKLKLRQMESLILNTGNMKEILVRYCRDNKEIVDYCVNGDQVRILCKQKKYSHNKSPPRPQSNKKSQDSEHQSKSASHISSQTPQISYKYFIRYFKFYSGTKQQQIDNPLSQQHFQQQQLSPQQNFIAFYPIEKPLELPKIHQENHQDPIQYQKIAYDPKNKLLVTNDQRDIYVVKDNKICWYQAIGNGGIIFLEVRRERLYVGTDDGVLRVFRVDSEYQLELEKIMGCYLQQYAQITHYSLTSTPDIILFVQNNTKLCMANLTTYSNYLVTPLPQKILKITSNILITTQNIYIDYYRLQGGLLIQQLAPSQKLIKIKDNLINMTEVDGRYYCVCDMGDGQFTVQQFDRL